MTKIDWKAKKVKLGSAIIGAAITLAIGIFIGNSWNTYAPYLGGKFTSNTSISWNELNEVYSALVNNYDGEIDKSAIIDGAKHGLIEAVGDKYTVYMNKEESDEFDD